MKYKGFTLIELIITVALFALIGIVITTSMIGLMGKNQEIAYHNFIKKLEDAACIYIDLNNQRIFKSTCQSKGSCLVTVETLLSHGLLTEDDLYNPNTKESITNSKNITITFPNQVTTCTYNE